MHVAQTQVRQIEDSPLILGDFFFVWGLHWCTAGQEQAARQGRAKAPLLQLCSELRRYFQFVFYNYYSESFNEYDNVYWYPLGWADGFGCVIVALFATPR